MVGSQRTFVAVAHGGTSHVFQDQVIRMLCYSSFDFDRAFEPWNEDENESFLLQVWTDQASTS